MNESAVGVLVGRYRLGRLLGTGGMAEVWEGVDETLKRRVAVKVVHSHLARDPDFVQRFFREARLVASLSHPNILAIFDVGSQGGRPFLVTPLMRGGRMTDRLQAPVEIADALSWLRGLASALEAAHASGIVHRDLKPSNVLFDHEGKPHLADFGIARSLEETSGLTMTGAVVGTPGYMAPEQVFGETPVPATDQYALSVLAYRLLAGRLPLEGLPTPSILQKTAYELLPPPSRWRTVLGPAVDAVFARALAKRPEERFPSCSALVEAVEAALVLGAGDPAAPVARPRPRWTPPAPREAPRGQVSASPVSSRPDLSPTEPDHREQRPGGPIRRPPRAEGHATTPGPGQGPGSPADEADGEASELHLSMTRGRSGRGVVGLVGLVTAVAVGWGVVTLVGVPKTRGGTAVTPTAGASAPVESAAPPGERRGPAQGATRATSRGPHSAGPAGVPPGKAALKSSGVSSPHEATSGLLLDSTETASSSAVASLLGVQGELTSIQLLRTGGLCVVVFRFDRPVTAEERGFPDLLIRSLKRHEKTLATGPDLAFRSGRADGPNVSYSLESPTGPASLPAFSTGTVGLLELVHEDGSKRAWVSFVSQ